jgi:hypothetical protein
MAEEKDIALLADNDIIVEIEVQEAPTVVIETTSTTTAEISGDSALGIVVGTLPTLAKEKTLTDGIASIEDKLDNLNVDVDLTPVAKENTLLSESQSIKDKIDNIEIPTTDLSSVAKEATLLAKVAELKEVLNSIDFTAIEQAIQNVENITAREATLIQGVEDIIKAVENIDFTDLENSIAEVKNAVANIDFSALAKEETLTQGISSVESKVEEVGNKIDNIKLPEIDTTELAKQGSNQEATNSKIYDAVKAIPDLSLLYAARAEKNDDGVNTYSIILPVTAKVIYDDNEVATIQL